MNCWIRNTTIDGQFKLFVETCNEYVKRLPENMHESEENWFQAIDKVVFTQKHKYITGWKWKVENDDKSKKSSRSSKKSSGRISKRSSHSSR